MENAILPGDTVVKNPLANAGYPRDVGSILNQEGSLEEEMETHQGPGGLQSMGSQRVGQD